MCGVYFALRSGKEHRDLQFNQIRIEATPSEKRYIKYTENGSKKTLVASIIEKLSQKLWYILKINLTQIVASFD